MSIDVVGMAVAGSLGGGGNPRSIDAAIPGLQDGDFVATWACSNSGSPVPVDSGWNQLLGNTGGWLGWRFINGNASTLWTFSRTSTQNLIVSMGAWRGVDPINPIEAWSNSPVNISTTSIVIPTINILTAEYLAFVVGNGRSGSVISAPVGTTKDQQLVSGAINAVQAHELITPGASGAATGSRTFTATNASTNPASGAMLALNEAKGRWGTRI